MVALGGACVVALGGVWFLPGGHAWFFPGGMHGFFWGACMVFSRGHAWFFLGGACIGYDEIRSMSGRYASYWNAFLCDKCIVWIKYLISSDSYLN